MCNTAQQRVSGSEQQAWRRRLADKGTRRATAPGAQRARGFHATPQSEQRGGRRREKNPHSFTGSPLKRDYEERSCVGQTLPTNSAGLGKGKRDPSGPQKFSEAQLRSSWQQQQQQRRRELEQRLPSASTMEPDFQACEQLREHVLRILRDKARQTAVFYLYLLLLLSAGAAPTAELATMQTASLARSLRKHCSKSPRKHRVRRRRRWDFQVGGTQFRAPEEEQTEARPSTRGAIKPLQHYRARCNLPTKKRKKCHSCFLLRCKETRVKVPSELASWLLT